MINQQYLDIITHVAKMCILATFLLIYDLLRWIRHRSIVCSVLLIVFRALADYDKDGKLTCDEFCVAMHLADVARTGTPLPPVLPPELVPTKARSGSFSAPVPPISQGKNFL